MIWIDPSHPLTSAGRAALAQAQAAAAAPEPHWTAVVTAVSAAIIALVALGAVVVALVLVRRMGRIMQSIDRTVEQIGPQAEPLLDHAARVAEDAGEITHVLRGEVDRVRETVDGLDHRVRAAADAAETRVRRLGAVLDIVQDEAEEILLDAAATARGVHAAAEELRRTRRQGAPDRPGPPDDGGRRPES